MALKKSKKIVYNFERIKFKEGEKVYVESNLDLTEEEFNKISESRYNTTSLTDIPKEIKDQYYIAGAYIKESYLNASYKFSKVTYGTKGKEYYDTEWVLVVTGVNGLGGPVQEYKTIKFDRYGLFLGEY